MMHQGSTACTHNRWFKVCQVSMASEKLLRKRAKEVIGDGVLVEKVAITVPLKDGNGGEELIMRPFGCISNLWKKVEDLLEENERLRSYAIQCLFQIWSRTGMGA